MPFNVAGCFAPLTSQLFFVFVFGFSLGHRSSFNIEGRNPLYDSVYLDLGTTFFHRVVRNHVFDEAVPEML